jgi:hypothetical protein
MSVKTVLGSVRMRTVTLENQLDKTVMFAASDYGLQQSHEVLLGNTQF